MEEVVAVAVVGDAEAVKESSGGGDSKKSGHQQQSWEGLFSLAK